MPGITGKMTDDTDTINQGKAESGGCRGEDMKSAKIELIKTIDARPEGIKVLQIRLSEYGRMDFTYDCWTAEHVLLVTDAGMYRLTSYECGKHDYDNDYDYAFRIQKVETFDPDKYPWFVSGSKESRIVLKGYERVETRPTCIESLDLVYDNVDVWIGAMDYGILLSLNCKANGPTHLEYDDIGYTYCWDFISAHLMSPYDEEYKKYAWEEHCNNQSISLMQQIMMEEPFEYLDDPMLGKRLTKRCYLLLRDGVPIALADAGAMIVWLNVEVPEITELPGCPIKKYDELFMEILPDLYDLMGYAIRPMLNGKVQKAYPQIDVENDQEIREFLWDAWRPCIEWNLNPQNIDWNETALAIEDVTTYRQKKRDELDMALQTGDGGPAIMYYVDRYRWAEQWIDYRISADTKAP